MSHQRIDQYMMEQGLAQSRSQAANLIKMGRVTVGGRKVQKPHQSVSEEDTVKVLRGESYVSRAGFKLASVARALKLDFKNTVVLDVGSSTGGFTDYALKNGAAKVYAVDVGTNQLHPSLRGNSAIKLYEQTDIRQFNELSDAVDIVVIDVSFISLKEILPTVARLSSKQTSIVAMCKPQFEAGSKLKNKGVIKNNTIRRTILKEFEQWLKTNKFYVVSKADSEVSGQKGNNERFYLLRLSN